MRMTRKSFWILVLLFALVPCPFLLKFGIEYRQASLAARQIKAVEQECDLVESTLDGFFKQNGRFPKALTDLNLRNLPVDIKLFGYVNNTNSCVITFHSGTGYNLLESGTFMPLFPLPKYPRSRNGRGLFWWRGIS